MSWCELRLRILGACFALILQDAKKEKEMMDKLRCRSGIITGGTFIGTGAAGMAQSFSDSGQGVIAVRVGAQSGGTAITVTDSDGKTIISSYAPELDFEVVILSSPDIVKGKTYKITVVFSSGEITAN